MPERQLRGAAYTGKHGCEHQDFMQPIRIVQGDDGSITFQIGSTHVTFNSTSALIAAISRPATVGVTAAAISLVG